MPRQAKKADAPVHDPEREREELIEEASDTEQASPQSEPSSEGSGDEPQATEAPAAPEYEEQFVTVRIKPELRAAKVRVRDGSGKEWVISDGEMRSVPESALKSNPKYLIQA